ncbi:MAG: hypothetical protein JWM77_1496 [Rhodospirillales bacterium]|jgi:hypothetical protein|nr:hypothetical protein [Rhodospirillales bacterium]
MKIASHLLATALVLPLFAAPALAQQPPDQQMPSVSEGATAPDDLCKRAQTAQAPSQPQGGPSSGSASSNSGGATGWSGAGTGGSYTGTTPGRAVPSSPQADQQPPVATGLDLSGTSANIVDKC